MAYNPPRTQQINTLRSLGGNFSYQGGVSGSSNIQRIKNSSYGAQRDPQAAYNAAIRQGEEDQKLLNNFVNFITGERVTNKIEGVLTAQAQTQVG